MFAVLCMTALQLFVWPPDSLGEPLKPSPSREEKLRLGERMYREGILPSGEPMQALVKGDMPVPGTAFTCVSCHQRSGLGSVEGGVSTPATNWPQLLKPLQMRYTRFGMNRATYFPIPVERPPYTDETLACAIRTGVDSRGRTMEDVMPRYLLADEDMALMIFYLKSLSSEFSPGISDTTFKFATVMTDDVSKEDRDAVLGPLLDVKQGVTARPQVMNQVDQRHLRGVPDPVEHRLAGEQAAAVGHGDVAREHGVYDGEGREQAVEGAPIPGGVPDEGAVHDDQRAARRRNEFGLANQDCRHQLRLGFQDGLYIAVTLAGKKSSFMTREFIHIVQENYPVQKLQVEAVV